jgi:hypothetical protein
MGCKIILIMLVFTGGQVFGQQVQGPPLPQPKIQKIVTIDDELNAAREFLVGKTKDDALFIRFFTTYSVPDYLSENLVLSLSFWLHSLTGPTPNESGNHGYYAPLAQRYITKEKDKNIEKFIAIRQVSGSNTLWWIDIRDYNWTLKSIELVSTDESYVRKPWIDGKVYDELREIAGNALMRADWFLMWTSDAGRAFDRGKKSHYYTLLYSSVTIPKNGAEYRKIWGISERRVVGGAVDIGKSIVARNNRELAGVRTEIGYHYETSDFRNSDNENDTIENLSIQRINGIPQHKGINRKSDAHEFITSTELDLQAYTLTDGNEVIVDVADASIVRDTRDLLGDVRVKTARGCITCHPQGLNPPLEAVRDYLKHDVELKIGTKEYKAAFDNFYNYERLIEKIQDDQVIYARAVVKTNGLLPDENSKIYQQITDWYDSPLSIEQAALECGVTIVEFKKHVNATVSARLSRLVKDPAYKIDRGFWENPKNGGFAQAMLLIKGETALVPVENKIIIVEQTKVMVGKDQIGTAEKGTKFVFEQKINGWYQIKFNGQVGYIQEKYVREN